MSKSSKVMELDDNVWNDKDTDDFLRYLKFEYFMCTYFAFKTLMEAFIGFVQIEEILVFGGNKINNFEPIGIIFILLLVQSGIAAINLTLVLTSVDDDEDAENVKQTD